MVYEAKLIKKIGADCPPGVQAGLSALAKTEAFTQALQKEVAVRNLVLEDVSPSVDFVYRKTLQRATDNDFVITLYKVDYTANECAALAAFLTVQSKWPFGLEWKEEERRWQTKH